MCRSSAAREKFPLATRARKSSSHERFIDTLAAVLSGHQRRKKRHWRRERLPTIIAWSFTPEQRQATMKIVEIREKTIPISSPIRNAYIDFSKMTLSLVAVVTDVISDGKPVVGYGFNSNGRYGQGKLMRERFIPRIMEASPESLVDA